jgi:hypothetical protein
MKRIRISDKQALTTAADPAIGVFATTSIVITEEVRECI